ncbi:alpha/beta fold hydrolase [Bacillaceae bacterium Marseille-Q3522]|nr:alpha/beta fold hydrolase [Bacillaceae bacterium Marseille-Q3522]
MSNPVKKINTERKRWHGQKKTISAEPLHTGHINGQVIWKKNKSSLLFYPAKQKKFKIPLFFIYSLINKPYLLDLAPSMSLIKSFTNSGFDVYLLDFGEPGFEDKDTTIDDYILKYIRPGVRRALLHSGAAEITLIGFCLGGTLATIYAAVAKEPIKNVILAVTPIDFTRIWDFNEWLIELREETIDVNELIDAIGVIPAPLMERGLRLVTKPIFYSHYLSLLRKSYDKSYVLKWSIFNQWAKDHVAFSGASLKQLMNDLGRDNKLICGEMIIGNQQVDLSAISANLLVLSSTLDQLVLEEQSKPLLEKVSSKDKTFDVLEGGHAALIMNGKIHKQVLAWLIPRSEQI